MLHEPGERTLARRPREALTLVGALASSAAAASSEDIQILQTAASIENLAVATYKTALTLPYIGGSSANAVVTKFAQVTMGQHAAACRRLQRGGRARSAARRRPSPTRRSCPSSTRPSRA